MDTPAIPTPANGPEIERNNIIRELVETERKYVQDLEVMQVRSGRLPRTDQSSNLDMQKYAQELSQSNTLDRDTIHLLFPNLNKLLNFQRRFLIRLEGTADMPWREQRWGILFTDNVSLCTVNFHYLLLMAMIPSWALFFVCNLACLLVPPTALGTIGGRIRSL